MSLRAFTHINANAVSCVPLRACSRAGLIKMQNVFARKKSQNSNALWVQKLSGCTIYRTLVVELLMVKTLTDITHWTIACTNHTQGISGGQTHIYTQCSDGRTRIARRMLNNEDMLNVLITIPHTQCFKNISGGEPMFREIEGAYVGAKIHKL